MERFERIEDVVQVSFSRMVRRVNVMAPVRTPAAVSGAIVDQGTNTAPVLLVRTIGRRRIRIRTGRGPGERIGDAELIFRSLMVPDPENVILKVRIIAVVNGDSAEVTENTVTVQNVSIINQNKGKIFL